MNAISRIIFGLRFRLLLLVLLVCAPLVGVALHSAAKERRRVKSVWKEQAHEMVPLAHQAEQALLKQSRELLVRVSKMSAVRSGNREACKSALNDVFASYPSYANLGVINSNNDVLASARTYIEPGDEANRRLFRRVLAGGGRFAIGDYAVDAGSGKPAVSFGYPVFDESRRVQAMVVATVKLEWLGRARSELSARIRPRATWTEIDRDGTILVRYPASRLSSGHRFPNPALVKTVFSQKDGIVEAKDTSGAPAFFAFACRDSQLVPEVVGTILSIPKHVLFAGPNRALIQSLSWIGVAAGFAFTLGWAGSTFLVIRPVKALVRASDRLASGVLSARTGLRHGKDELGQLACTFDQMAQAIQERDRQQRLTEETLQTRDHMIRELPLLPAAVCVCDQFGSLQLYNHTAVEMWGYDPGDQAPNHRYCGAQLLFYPDGMPMPHAESPAAEVLRTGTPLRNRELIIGRPDGTRVPVLANVVPLRDSEGLIIGVVSCYQDISDRKRSEARLLESNEKLQLLSRRLVESQETERRHIARELHDEVGQTLTVAEMNLQAVVQSSRGTSLRVRLKESLQAVERVLGQVRDLSLNLRPSMLDDLGLEPALRWYINRQAAAAGLQVEFQADTLDQRLDPVVETACFRIAQEALTNVSRHARAHSVKVELQRQNGFLHLFVRDDGIGFDAAAVRERAVLGASLGLLSMEERATLTDGGFECKSAPGQGSEIHAWFPLRWRTTEA
ncbi:MAG TPA: histidine kinase [Candidatus Paceibacterota bacterium]|nr:histidine kinase [Verrucomicrobiota bacterium]HSA13000.1 histidine kinase [Candidatus Paceibacterota bacterium]